MVERIPRPPDEDIIKSAKGIKTEGYKHQLNFYIQRLVELKVYLKAILKNLIAKLKF